jgi:hypothetical protein
MFFSSTGLKLLKLNVVSFKTALGGVGISVLLSLMRNVMQPKRNKVVTVFEGQLKFINFLFISKKYHNYKFLKMIKN